MRVMTQEQRIAAEQQVREKLGLPMMCTNVDNTVSAETLQIEREILGVQAYGFGEVWGRLGLTIQERCFITLAILTAKYQLGPLADYVRASLRVGISPTDILDAVLHVGTYAGLTATSEALTVARRVFADEGITKPSQEPITPVYPMDHEGRREAQNRVAVAVAIGRQGHEPDAPMMAYPKNGVWSPKAKDTETEQDFNFINGQYGYGENWGRPGLGYRIRSFLTLAALQAQVLNDQLHFHLNNALNLGITGDEIHELLGHGAVYCGGANWRNAANVAREVLLMRGVVEPA